MDVRVVGGCVDTWVDVWINGLWMDWMDGWTFFRQVCVCVCGWKNE